MTSAGHDSGTGTKEPQVLNIPHRVRLMNPQTQRSRDVAPVDRAVRRVPPSIRGADLERISRLQREFENEAERIIRVVRTARHELAAAHDKLNAGLALELYIAAKNGRPNRE